MPMAIPLRTDMCKPLFAKKWFAWLRLCLYAITFAFFIMLPAGFFEIGSICIFYNLFNIKCPGCGMTRAFYHMLRGNVMAALHNNLLSAIVFPVFLVLSFNDAFVIIKRTLLKEDFLQFDKNSSIVERILLRLYPG